MIARALSVNWVQIHVSDEAWQRSITVHPDLELEDVLDTISSPDGLYRGAKGELYAVRHLPDGKWLIAVYTEAEEAGEFIDAFYSNKGKTPEMKEQV
jgi:hypothetical protein